MLGFLLSLRGQALAQLCRHLRRDGGENLSRFFLFHLVEQACCGVLVEPFEQGRDLLRFHDLIDLHQVLKTLFLKGGLFLQQVTHLFAEHGQSCKFFLDLLLYQADICLAVRELLITIGELLVAFVQLHLAFP